MIVFFPWQISLVFFAFWDGVMFVMCQKQDSQLLATFCPPSHLLALVYVCHCRWVVRRRQGRYGRICSRLFLHSRLKQKKKAVSLLELTYWTENIMWLQMLYLRMLLMKCINGLYFLSLQGVWNTLLFWYRLWGYWRKKPKTRQRQSMFSLIWFLKTEALYIVVMVWIFFFDYHVIPS